MKNNSIVVCWVDGKRSICLPAADGAAIFPFETRQHVALIYEVIDKFYYAGEKKVADYTSA